MKNKQKGFIVQGIVALIALVLIVGGAYYAGTKKAVAPETNWKTYTDSKSGIEFNYPSKLALTTSDGRVNLSHSILFENYDGGCDMVGNAELSKTLTDFNVSFDIVPGDIKPSYIDGDYLAGTLKGNWAYQGAEGCGQTLYYFPVEGNKTLVVTKQELQILSPIVSAEVRNKVLEVLGVISHEESGEILKQILSTFKFTSPVTNSTPSITILSPNGGETLKVGQTYKISFRSIGDLGSKTIRLNSYSYDGIRLNSYFVGTTENNSEFNFTIPSGVEVTRFGPNYMIQVLVDKYNTGKGVADESDNYFSITN